MVTLAWNQLHSEYNITTSVARLFELDYHLGAPPICSQELSMFEYPDFSAGSILEMVFNEGLWRKF